MDTDQKQFFMLTVEIRILASVMARISGRSLEERFNPHDISALQYGIIHALSHESLTLSDLSRRFLLDPSTLVPVVHTLERKHLVVRSRDPNDRRRWLISVTEAGTQLIRRMPVFDESDLLYQILNSLGEDKSRQLLSLLREIIERMPEGEEMLESITTRLYALQDGENIPKPHGCVMHHKQLQQQDAHPMIRRVIRPRIRRNRHQ